MFADPSGEIIRQLTRIADATNKPAPAPWIEPLKNISTFCAGLVAAYLTQQLQARTSESHEHAQMRRIVYMELAKNFLMVDGVVRPHVKDDGTLILTGNRWRMLKTFATYDGEAYMKEHTPTFYQLEEGEVLTTIYYWFHKIDGNPKYAHSEIFTVQRKSDDAGARGTDCPIYGLAEMKAPLGWFSDCYRQYPILKKQLKKFVTAADFKYIDSATTLYRHASTFEELADAGIISIVRREEVPTTSPEPPPPIGV